MVGSSATPWTYDAAGRLLSIPGHVSGYSYNARGQVVYVTYANGAVTANSYDPSRHWLTGASSGSWLRMLTCEKPVPTFSHHALATEQVLSGQRDDCPQLWLQRCTSPDGRVRNGTKLAPTTKLRLRSEQT